jgi:small GTP-binding protein
LQADLKFKICIFGDFAVGKTALARRYLTNLFDATSRVTLGMEIHVKVIETEGHKIALQIWDFGGQRRFRYLLPTYARGSFGGIFMYDITNKESIADIPEWLAFYNKGLLEEPERVPLLLIGGKLDLTESREVSLNEALNVKVEHKFIDLVECSSKTGENVEQIFEKIVREILKIRGFL